MFASSSRFAAFFKIYKTYSLLRRSKLIFFTRPRLKGTSENDQDCLAGKVNFQNEQNDEERETDEKLSRVASKLRCADVVGEKLTSSEKNCGPNFDNLLKFRREIHNIW